MIYDVIIVGAGPSGASLAYFLGNSPYKVLLLDRSEFPREKACGGAVTRETVEKFPHLKDLMEIEYYIGGMYYKPQYEPIINESEIPLGYMVRRIVFDNELVNLVRKFSNIEIKFNSLITKVENLSDKVVVQTDKNEQFEGRILVGADGTNSIIRRKTNLQKFWREEHVSFVVMNEIKLDEATIEKYYTKKHKSIIHLAFQDSYGYGWVFSKKEHINIGFGAMTSDIPSKQIMTQFNAYIKYAIDNDFIPDISSAPEKPRGAMLPSGGPSKHFTDNRILLVGDAGGFVQPFSGEGIKYAIWSSKIASTHILQFLEHQIPLEDMMKAYEKEIMKSFGKDLKKIAKFVKFSLQFIGVMFQLAKHDPLINELQSAMFELTVPFDKIRVKIALRMVRDFFKGYLWKK